MKAKHQNRKTINNGFCWLVILMTLFLCSCAKQTSILANDKTVETSASPNAAEKTLPEPTNSVERVEVSNTQEENRLKKLLEEASWEAINEANRQGISALPIIRPFLENDKYQVRQMAVSSAGAIGDDKASDILAAGLKDSNINVRLAAAKELSKQAYPSAAGTVLEVIRKTPDETVKELLVKAAGFLPGSETIATLRPLSKGKNVLADQAIYALAKLGDPSGINSVSKKLSAPLPRTRYETLQNLCYINDLQFVPKAKKLLSDKADAIRVGSIRSRQMRRVADAAVVSLVCLLKLDLPFKPSKNLYTDEEINTVRELIIKKEK